MKAPLATLLVLASLLALAASVPTVFMGGNFLGLGGTATWEGVGDSQFAAYHRGNGQWSTAIQQPNLGAGVLINDIDDAQNGVFAVGSFETITATGIRTEGVAFWDGSKWCSIRQAIDGVGKSVFCDSESSCWVTGEFTTIHNMEADAVVNEATRFVHYSFDSTGNEWVVVEADMVWNRPANTTNLLAGNLDPSRLYGVGSGESMIFYTSVGGLATIWRGSRANNGWATFAIAASVSAGGGAIRDWTVDGTNVLVVLDSSPEFNGVNVRASGTISATVACTANGNCITDPTDWSDLVGSVNGSVFVGYYAIAASGSTRYLVVEHDEDGGGPEFNPHFRVVSHTGGAALTLVGQAFSTGAAQTVFQLFVDENSNVVAVGPTEGNLFYPPNTDQDSGVTSDIRTTDRFNNIAVFDGTRWVQAFGGGIRTSSASFATTLREAYNSRTSEWFFVGPFTFVYDVHADSAAYYDNDGELTTPYFALFSRKLQRRGGAAGEVFDIVCAEADCADVYVGGTFHFHGPDTFGAVASIAVDNSGSPAVSVVGGGLWNLGVTDPDDPTLQVNAGSVYALARDSRYLYAGGKFSRGSLPENPNFACLNNIARLDIDTPDAAWEDLHGGCDDEVYDILFWRGLLFAAGEFHQCGGGRVVNFVASYSYQSGENAQWASLNNGLSATAYSLESFDGRLIVGGDFQFAGGLPVTGVASWDGFKWRALLPACTDDCVSGSDFYFTNPLAQITAAHDLRTDQNGDRLWARVVVGSNSYLANWQYVDGDLGRWLPTGDAVELTSTAENKGHRIANLGSDNGILASGVPTGVSGANYGSVGVYHAGIDNWVVDSHAAVNDHVFVIRGPQASSANSLSSPLSAFLSLF